MCAVSVVHRNSVIAYKAVIPCPYGYEPCARIKAVVQEWIFSPPLNAVKTHTELSECVYDTV